MSDTNGENQLRLANTVEALQDSEKRYRRLFESAQDGILILDADTGEVVDVNPFLLQLLGYSYSAICGQHIWELGVFKDIAASKDAFKTLQDNEYIRYEDLPLESLDRRPIAVEFVSNVYMVDQRKVIQCNIRDITARKRTDQRLRDLAAIVESSDDAIISKTLEGCILTWNKAAERIYGYTAGEIVGQSVSILIPQDQPDELSKILAKLKSGETATHYETVRVRKDGERIHVSLAISPVKNAEARIVGASTIARDITERKRAEEALRESEEKYRRIVETANEGICVADGDYLVTYVNRKMADILGYLPEEIIGKPLGHFLFPEDLADYEKKVSHRIQGNNETYESRFRRKDGGECWTNVSSTAISTEDGRFAGSFGMFSDITERKLAEDALRESEERFSKFFHASTVGTSITRLSDSQFADVNDAYLGLFGYTREEVIGQNPLKLGMWANPEDRAEMVDILQEQGRIQDFETRFHRKSGEIMDALLSAEVIELAGQRYILGLTHDITDRKRGERERKKLEEQLFQAQKMESVGRLAGGVAHDFNNMLGVIIGRAEMALEQDIPTDKLQHNLKEILKAGLRSAGLTRQLLAFARKQTAIPKVLDLNDTISGMLKMLRRLIGEDIDLLWIPELDLWKVKIDPSQVDQILANLVVNARDAIPGVGAITLRTDNVVIDETNRAETPEFIPGEYALLTISDTGEGMSEKVRENIFEPFFTTKEPGRGTGLGLSTVYGIVKQNDGFIYVASELGKGTTFKIYLPRFEAETAQVPFEEITGKSPTGTETILVVEDDEPILSLSKMILENLGYTVLAVQTPTQAIRLAKEHPGDIHLLITDVVMPKMNGRELAEQLTAIRPNLKCLYMSGYTADVIAHRGILYEGVNFIQKPFGSDDLAARVRQVLEHSE
jgi:PAS domain S-box-containing protein